MKSRLSIDVKIMSIEHYYQNNCSLDEVSQIFQFHNSGHYKLNDKLY